MVLIHWEMLSQNQPVKLLLSSWPTELCEVINVCCYFKLLNFGITYYAAISYHPSKCTVCQIFTMNIKGNGIYYTKKYKIISNMQYTNENMYVNEILSDTVNNKTDRWSWLFFLICLKFYETLREATTKDPPLRTYDSRRKLGKRS